MVATGTRPTSATRRAWTGPSTKSASDTATLPAGRPMADLGTAVDSILNRWPAVGLAVGLVRDGHLVAFIGRGLADIRSGTPITEDTVFRIASITKTVTAVAILQLWEEGLLDLDAPADEALRAYRLVPASPADRQPTIRELLTHTAGIPEMVRPSGMFQPDFGESVSVGEPVPTLTEYYSGALRLAAAPGTRFTYGNHGFATLGQIVADVSGVPFEAYLRERIFAPLGMVDSDLIRTDVVRARLATGYRIRHRGPVEVRERDMITAGAASVYSTPRDMARYLAALLGGGRNEHGSILRPATVASMFAPQYQPDPRIPGVGLSFFRGSLSGHRVVEHQGVHPGFDSQILLAADDGIAVMAFTNGTRLGMLWLPSEISDLLGSLLGATRDRVRDDVPQRPDAWTDLIGWYRLRGPLTDVRLRSVFGAGVEVLVRRGRLWIRALGPIPPLFRGFELHPDDATDPDVFRIDLAEFGVGSIRVVFRRGADGRVVAVHPDVMPLTLERASGTTDPLRIARAALVTSAFVGTLALRRRRGRSRRR